MEIQSRPFFALKQPCNGTDRVFRNDALFFSCVCLFFLANEASHPVFMFVCHRSGAALTIHLSIVFSN